MIKPAYSVSFLLSINIFVWQNVLYFPNDSRTYNRGRLKGNYYISRTWTENNSRRKPPPGAAKRHIDGSEAVRRDSWDKR